MGNREVHSAQFSYWKWIGGIIASVGSFVLSLTDQICAQPILKWFLIILMLFFLCVFLHELWFKVKKHTKHFKLIISVFLLFIYVFFVGYIFLNKCPVQESGGKQPPFQINNSGDNAGATINNPTTKNISNIDNSTNNYYNKPVQRSLTASDIQQFKDSLVDKDQRILVMYQDSRLEDTLLFKQTCAKLEALGYTDINRSPVSVLPVHLKKGRFSILRIRDKIKLIINPQ